jgi:hypothetical protein
MQTFSNLKPVLRVVGALATLSDLPTWRTRGGIVVD